jgi:AraC-like DNA-binding protein
MTGDLHFLHCGHVPQCVARVNKYFVGYYTLQFMSSGGLELLYDDRKFTLTGGQWFWPANPGPHIRFHPATGHLFWVHRYVAFKGPLVGRWIASGLISEEQQPQAAPRNRDFVPRFDELLSQVQRSNSWGNLRAVNLLEGLLLELSELRAQPAARETWLDEVLEELMAEESVTLNYTKLARRHGMALSTLRRRFRAATGTALHTYALQCRIATARGLLGDTDLPVKLVAERLGYNDVYFFSRQFKKLSGTSPAAYRRSRQS